MIWGYSGEHSLILCLLGVPRRICGLLHIAEILQTELTEGGQRLALVQPDGICHVAHKAKA